MSERNIARRLLVTYHHKVLGPRRRLDGLRQLILAQVGPQIDKEIMNAIDQQVKELNAVERLMRDELNELENDYWIITKPVVYWRKVRRYLILNLIKPFLPRKAGNWLTEQVRYSSDDNGKKRVE